jgi:microcystin-dependent protein
MDKITISNSTPSVMRININNALESVVSAINQIANNLTPVGTVSYIAYSTIPDGWLECNGQAVSRTDYSELFGKIGTTYGIGDGSTTFNVPDLRGEFIRGLDNGRGIDSSRALGSEQLDALQNITGAIGPTPFQRLSGAKTGAFGNIPGAVSNDNAGRWDEAPQSGIDFDASRVVRTSKETRPRNIALLAIIKAKNI